MTQEWGGARGKPAVFKDGVVGDLVEPQCHHCGRSGLPLILFGDQEHAVDTQWALVCQNCLAEARAFFD